MHEVNLKTHCPHCNNDLMVKTNFPSDPLELAPDVRGAKEPSGCIFKYRITSDELKKFITEKAKSYVPDVEVEIVPRYCEKKRKKNYEAHRSYAYLKVALSDKVIQKNADLGFFGSIGDSQDNCPIISTILKGLIQKYSYVAKNVEEWSKSYTIMEELEDIFGITELFIEDIKKYVTPKRISSKDNEKEVIIFSAAPENIIRDYLTDVTTNKLPGKMEIMDVYPISEGVVEWVVEIDSTQHTIKEDPYVRQLLMNEYKNKK